MTSLNKKLRGWWIADKSYLRCVQVTENIYFTGDGPRNEDRPIYVNFISEVKCEVCWRENFCMVFKNIDDAKYLLILNIEKEQSFHERVNVSPNKSRSDQALKQMAMAGGSVEDIKYVSDHFEKSDRRMAQHHEDMYIMCEKRIENIRKCGDALTNELFKELNDRKSKMVETIIRERAYFIAEADGFTKHPEQYWEMSFNEYYS